MKELVSHLDKISSGFAFIIIFNFLVIQLYTIADSSFVYS